MEYTDVVNLLDLVPCELEFNNQEFNISVEFLLCEDNLRRIHAFNKLLNVARYRNGSEELSLNNKKTFKYYIQYRVPDKKIHIINTHVASVGQVLFKSEEAAKKAVQILGRETLLLALGVK